LAPDGKLNGMDNAAASETIPLIPIQLTAVTVRQDGAGSSGVIGGKNLLRK